MPEGIPPVQMKATVRSKVKQRAEEDATATRIHRAPPRLRSILLATDFSEAAALAGARVARLPLAPECRITVLHVARTEAEAQTEHCEERIAKVAAPLREALVTAGVSSPLVAPAVVFGKAAETIVASAHDVELVVLGRHGAGGLVDLLLGSTAERVVQTAAAPVLVVGPKRRAPYRRAVVGVDLSPTSLTALEFGMRLVPDGSVEIVYAYERLIERALLRSGCAGEEIAARRAQARAAAALELATFLEPLDAATAGCTRVVQADDPRVALLNRATRRRASLIVVGGRPQSPIARVLLGSVATAVLRHAECDVLVVPGGTARVLGGGEHP